MPSETVTAYLGLGSNLGDREANLRMAIDLLSRRMRTGRLSSVYDTAPVGDIPQPRFLNMACEISTTLAPPLLLFAVKNVEMMAGRRGKTGEPRIIDIDILLYGDQVYKSADLEVPHPRLAERAFALIPLAEIAPEVVHPVKQKTIKQLKEAVPDQDVHFFGEFSTGKKMYEVAVELHFDAAHFLRGYQGKCEAVHGHRFKVVARLTGKQTDDTGMLYDFTLLKRHLGDVVNRFDHVLLNDLPPFDKINPSSENIARTIYGKLKPKLKGAPVALSAIEVWESPESRVIYTPGRLCIGTG